MLAQGISEKFGGESEFQRNNGPGLKSTSSNMQESQWLWRRITRSPSKKCRKRGTDIAGVEIRVKKASDSSKLRGLSAAFAKKEASEHSTASSRDTGFDC